MSMRCPLFSTNYVPGDATPLANQQWSTINEYVCDLPLAGKILISVNPRACRSELYEDAEGCAVIADYAGGVQRLLAFLDEVDIPGIEKFRVEARKVLQADDRRDRYLLLEPFEIFESVRGDLAVATRELIDEVQDFTSLLNASRQFLKRPAPQPKPEPQYKPMSFWDKLLGRAPQLETRIWREDMPNPDQLFFDFGVGYWEDMTLSIPPGTNRQPDDA